eukprot:m.20320 g.20320  ORF g.20320 m.20320 type:complete len:229 (+) comp6805_c0_seq1:220-906(+)
MEFNGKVAVVTGINEVTLAISKSLVSHGARVAFAGKDAEKGQRMQTLLGQNASFIHADVDDVSKVFNSTLAMFGRVDLVFNHMSLTNLDQSFNINVKTAVRVIQQALPILERNGKEGGVIVNTSSVTSTINDPGYSSYAASKAALDSYSRILAEEVSDKGIKVFIMDPFVTPFSGSETSLFEPSTANDLAELVVGTVKDSSVSFSPPKTLKYDRTNALNLMHILQKVY